jgi:hypothetical protein
VSDLAQFAGGTTVAMGQAQEPKESDPVLKPTDLLSDVQLRLSAMTCPNCHSRGLALRIRCDLDAGDCLYLGICEDCAAEYWIDRDSAPDEIEGPVCRVCGSPHCSVALYCDSVTHRCAYGVSYTPCRH